MIDRILCLACKFRYALNLVAKSAMYNKLFGWKISYLEMCLIQNHNQHTTLQRGFAFLENNPFIQQM